MKKEKVKKPVCPYCGEEMTIVHFIGYYDEFSYWECKCKDSDLEKNVEYTWRGGYA